MTSLSGIGPVEVLILALRLAFLVVLYVVVATVLQSLRRQLRGAALPAAGGAPESAVAPHPAPPVARLTLLEASPADGPPGRAVALNGTATIGRRPPADILLRDDAVSGRHARFVWRNGTWMIEDLGSTNGTYINGRRLNGPAGLQAGDVVVTGGATWRFEDGRGQ